MARPDFTPTSDVAALLNHLLDIYERRDGAPKQAVRVRLAEAAKSLPGYYNQADPTPRLTANEQVTRLAGLGYLALTWEPGQAGHLLETIALVSDQAASLYDLLNRQPLAQQRQRLREMLLAERVHLTGWRNKAIEHCLAQLRQHKSPAPFSLTNIDLNRDLLTILHALPDDETHTEISYRMFSVRVFNDSKRFEPLQDTIARLARRHQPRWRDLPNQAVLREMGLVANPNHLYLYGPWRLVDADGQVISLAEFYPSVGIPADLAGRVQQVKVDASRVVCVENLASFYELVRHRRDGVAALCLWGNPAPVVRHLLRCLVDNLAPSIPLHLWADIDYGGLNILAQLRPQVSPRFEPYLMDSQTLDRFAKWGQPLTAGDVGNLNRLQHHPALSDMGPLIDHMLLREIKLEQEAIVLAW